jgi:hypothetical protein
MEMWGKYPKTKENIPSARHIRKSVFLHTQWHLSVADCVSNIWPFWDTSWRYPLSCRSLVVINNQRARKGNERAYLSQDVEKLQESESEWLVVWKAVRFEAQKALLCTKQVLQTGFPHSPEEKVVLVIVYAERQRMLTLTSPSSATALACLNCISISSITCF